MPFTASIIERQFIYIPDRILKLGGAAWLRKLPVLTMPWQRIRIGLLCAVTPDSTSNIYETMFLLGVCSGTEYPGASANTLNFVGASIIGAATPGATRTLTYTASTNGPYYAATAGYFFAKTEGSIYSTAAVFSPAASIATTSDVTSVYKRRTLLVLDISRPIGGTGGTLMAMYGPSTSLVQTTDYRPDDLQEALDQLGTPTIRGQAMSVLSTNTTVMSSTLTGNFDTLEVFWSNNNNPLEISAIGAMILLPPYYSDLSISTGLDSFEEYGTTTGSIPESTFLDGGSYWGTTGSIAYNQTQVGLTVPALGNTSNLAPQISASYLGTTCMPDETFEQYAVGTLDSGITVNQGSFFFSPATTVVAMPSLAPQVYTKYIGTVCTPDDPFEQYATGTLDSGITVNQGSFWGGPATTIIAAGNPAAELFGTFVGTTFGPYDSFESYTVNNGSTTYGTTTYFTGSAFMWNGTGIVYSGGSNGYYQVGTTTQNPMPAYGDTYGTNTLNALYGTAVALPYDTFEQYGTGAVVSGVTINAGTGFDANGGIWSYVLA